MFTNNYIAYKKARFLHTNMNLECYNGTMTIYQGQSSLQPDIGAVMGWGRCKAVESYRANGATGVSFGDPGVYFGTGSTPAAKTDTNLESVITSGLEITNPNSVLMVDEGNGKYSYVSDFIVRNTGSTEVNIREIGLYSKVANQDTYTTNYPVLYERTVLDAPVTIPAGEAKMVTYKITFNQPA